MLAIIFLSGVLRYPLFNHEHGRDSFAIHSFARSIVVEGRQTWIIHNLSFIGLTPEAYPSSVPSLLAGLSLLTGLNVEMCILMMMMVLSVMIPIVGYVFGKEMFHDKGLALVTAFFFTTIPSYVFFTTWTVTTRNLFIILLPIFYINLFKVRSIRNINIKYFLLAFCTFFLLLSTHRMALFLPASLLAFLVANFFHTYYPRLQARMTAQHRPTTLIPILFFPVLAFAIFIQYAGVGFYSRLGTSYETGILTSEVSPTALLINMIVDYMSTMGLMMFLTLMGILLLVVPGITTVDPRAMFRRLFRRGEKDLSDHPFYLHVLSLMPGYLKKDLADPDEITRGYSQRLNLMEYFQIFNLLFFSFFLLMGSYTSLYLIPTFIFFAVACVKVIREQRILMAFLLTGIWGFYFIAGYYVPGLVLLISLLVGLLWLSLLITYLSTHFDFGGVDGLAPAMKRYVKPMTAIILILMTVSFSVFINEHWFKPREFWNYTHEIEDETLNTVQYMNDIEPEHRYLTNDPITEPKMRAHWIEPEDYKLDNFTIVDKGDIWDILFTDQYLIITRGGDQSVEHPFFKDSVDDDNVQNLLKIRKVDYVIVTKDNSTHHRYTESLQEYKESNFLIDLEDGARYTVFDSGRELVYYMRQPIPG